MGAQDVRHVVNLEEFPHHLCSERVPCPARRQRELVVFRIRIRPHQIGHRALVRDFSEPVDNLDLVDGMDRR